MKGCDSMWKTGFGRLLSTTCVGTVVAVGAGCGDGGPSSSPVARSKPAQGTPAAPAHGPRLAVDQPEYDGDAVGLTVRHQYLVRNAGDQDLKIANVETSCGCTTTSLERPNLAPGESTEIGAVLDVSGGRLESSLYVYSNDPSHPITPLVIRAKQRPAGLSTLTFLPSVVRVAAKPGDVAAGEALLRMTTFGDAKKRDFANVPKFDQSTDGIILELSPLKASESERLASFGQVRPASGGSGVVFEQAGLITQVWSVRYKVKVGDEAGVFRMLTVARLKEAGAEVSGVLGFLIEVSKPPGRLSGGG